MSKNVILYETLNDVKTMKSYRGEDGFIHLSGVFGVCGVVNNNKRIYEAGNYKKMIDEMKQRIKESGCPGELEHPNTMNITLENVSHKIDSIDIDENGVVTGEITLLDTPKGKIAQSIVEGGLPLFISSRAQGNVDGKGRVTLEKLSTYDLVGTPGFSQAKLNLKENQVVESICESIYYIENKENNEKENTEFDMDNKELMERIETLESTVRVLKEELSQKRGADVRSLTEGIQAWVSNEFSKDIEKFIKEDFSNDVDSRIETAIREYTENSVAPGIEKWFADEMAPKINEWMENEFAKQQEANIREYIDNEYSTKVGEWISSEFANTVEKWITEQYSGEVEKWITEHYSTEVQNWTINEFAPEIQNWLNEEFSKGLQKWIVEEYSPVIEKWILTEAKSELLKDVASNTNESQVASRTEKLTAIDSILKMLEESQQDGKTKPVFKGSRMVSEGLENEPLFVKQMPQEYVAKWNMASNAVKESIKRKASVRSLMNEEQIARFWESVDFSEPTQSVKESLDNSTMDANERALRTQLRAFRKNQ